MITVFENGTIINTSSFEEIRERAVVTKEMLIS
jgi:nicotinamide phosphoribosyltransferase